MILSSTYLYYYVFLMEEWKEIPWFNGLYLVSNTWRVKSLMYWKERVLKQNDYRWYRWVKLYINKTCKHLFVHRLVMISFHWEHNYKKFVNHIDRDKANNYINNLERVTHQENMIHDRQTETIEKKNIRKEVSRINGIKCSKSVKQYSIEWELIDVRNSTMDIQRDKWYWNQGISRCCRWIQKKAYWFVWKY